jgi:TP901 family phage tail tape measure protein
MWLSLKSSADQQTTINLTKKETEMLQKKKNKMEDLHNTIQDSKSAYKSMGDAEREAQIIDWQKQAQKIMQGTSKVNAHSAAYRELAKMLRQFDIELERIQKSTTSVSQAARNELNGIVKSLGAFMKRIGMMSLRRMFSEATEFAKEFGDALNDIRIVTLKSQEDAEKLGRSYTAMGQSMKVSATEIATSASSLYRQGLTDSQVQARLESAIQFSKVAKIDVAEAVDTITVLINTGLVNTAQRATDVLNALGDAAATDADEIAEAIKRSASVAKAAGVDFEHLATWIALVSERTRLAPEVIGTSIQSMLSRLHSMTLGQMDEDGMGINQVEAALQRVNAELEATNPNLQANLGLWDEATKSWKSGQQVFEEIAAVWYEMSDAQQAVISSTVAMRRQRDRFLNLMDAMADESEGASRYQGLLSVAMTATGSTARKYETWMEGAEAAQDGFRASLENLFNTLGASNTFTVFYNTLAKLTSLFTSGMGSGGLVAAMGAFAAIVIKLVRAFQVPAGGGKSGIMAILTGTASLKTILMVVGAIGALVSGIVGLVNGFGKVEKLGSSFGSIQELQTELKEATEQNIKYNNTMRDYQQQLKDLKA